MKMQNIRFIDELPRAEEYLALRKAVDWDSPGLAACKTGLPNSVYSVLARRDKELIGMGRIVGDGVFTFFIVDIIVKPEYQRQGLGTEIMKRIMAFLKKSAVRKAYITLLAARGKEPFYEKYGFFKRPTEKYGHGMMLPME